MNALARLAVVALLAVLPGCTRRSRRTGAAVHAGPVGRTTAAGARDGVARERRRQCRRQTRRHRRGPDEASPASPEWRWPSCTAERPCTPRVSASRMYEAGEKSRRRHGVSAGVVVQAAERDGGRPPGRRERDRLGHPDRVASCRGSPCPIRWSRRWSPSATCSRTAPGCPTTPATCWRTSATTADMCLTGCVQLPLDPFRISYAYTNFGFTAGAEAVAVSAGKSWEDLADEVLFDPLGMASTSYRFADYESGPNRAVGHIHVDGRYEPRYVRDADPEAPAGGRELIGQRHDPLAGDGAGRTAATTASRSSTQRRCCPRSPHRSCRARATEPAMRSGFYGYGFNVGSTSAARMELSHSGAFELGAGTNFVILPSADVAIVALTNAHPVRGARIADRRVRRPRAVRRGAGGLVQALRRPLRGDGGARRALWSASSRPPIPRRRRR